MRCRKFYEKLNAFDKLSYNQCDVYVLSNLNHRNILFCSLYNASQHIFLSHLNILWRIYLLLLNRNTSFRIPVNITYQFTTFLFSFLLLYIFLFYRFKYGNPNSWINNSLCRKYEHGRLYTYVLPTSVFFLRKTQSNKNSRNPKITWKV